MKSETFLALEEREDFEDFFEFCVGGTGPFPYPPLLIVAVSVFFSFCFFIGFSSSELELDDESDSNVPPLSGSSNTIFSISIR